ncbi:hypothetical protein [Paraburkholderia sp.]|uniref:hypothetical protein n=1 Tax=Paraburkholderia sp. TaxID=1926495 RepID=UPI00238FF490|nr:hypothetical protein [Paraburkholderia sp.]MDE1182323.1 hypothetical protein [Paraburkholderia sp.]
MSKELISMKVRYAALIELTQTYHDALEQVMRHSRHHENIDLNSAKRALASIYKIARECRNVDGE